MPLLNIEELRKLSGTLMKRNIRRQSETCHVLRDIIQRDRSRSSLTPKINGLNNEAYRNALQAFIDRRRSPNELGCITSPNSPDKDRFDFFTEKNENELNRNKKNETREKSSGIPGVPHVRASDIFEIGWIAGTEDRYMELMFAEWQSTRISLRRHTHPDCRDAIKADLEVLTEIRHPNVLLLMATTHTDDHGLVALFEPIDCTLYNFIHEQGERVSVQGIAKCAGNLAGALKHAHMRGYVHGAVSSHCVFLATCGTVKLGGWELAGSPDTPKANRGYEQRLRYEIFRWQAPEIFRGQEPSKATDVYCLALLLWEMCTMNIPWNGLSKSEVERQYLERERGVVTDLYNFPPLLNKLLNAGLQLDASKRTLDMCRMRRFLQTLEIQYEDAEPIFVETSTNNNNNNNNNSINSSNNNNNSKTMIYNAAQESASSDTPSLPRYTSVTMPKRYSERKIIETRAHTPRTLNLNLIEEPEKLDQRDISSFEQNETATTEIIERILKPPSPKRIDARNIKEPSSNEKSSKATKHGNPKIIDSRTKLPGETKFSSNLTRTLDSTDDEEASSSATRTSIKKLRQKLAEKRKDFFYGSDSSQFSPNEYETCDNTKSHILTQVRSKDYEPHKPASHKTCLEPKQTKSSGQYNSLPSTISSRKSQKSPYSYVPTAIRDAVVQPKVLNSDSQSFFETSLWRKEKAICISRMRKNDIDDSTFCISRWFPRLKYEQTIRNRTESIVSNETYTIDATKGYDSILNKDETRLNDNLADTTTSTITRNKSLQALKDSLERATEIVLSNNSKEESPIRFSSSSSPPPKNLETFDPNDSAMHESIFEDIYELRHDADMDDEIKSIERTNDGETAYFSLENKSDTKDEDSDKIIEPVVRRRSVVAREEIKREGGFLDVTRLSSVVCQSIAENLNENENSSTDSKPNDKTVVSSRSFLNPETAVPAGSSTFELCNDDVTEAKHHRDKSEAGLTLMVFGDNKNHHCQSCNSTSNLARRRSLPAALGQLRNLNNASLGKLPIRKGDVPDNTVEDIYIDDEFGGSLNVNMILLDGCVTTDDEDFLHDVELSNAQK